MKRKIWIYFILTALLTSQVLTSCKETQPVSDESRDSETQNDTSTIIETAASDEDELPDITFDGREFKILATDSTNYKAYVDVAETNGDVLNDSIYTSNRNVENRFDAVIAQTVIPLSEANNTVIKLLMAGDHEYDIMSITDRFALQQAVQGTLLSYGDMPYIDLDKDYWCKSINKTITIAGEQWLAYGDFNLSVYDYTYVLAFNKQLL